MKHSTLDIDVAIIGAGPAGSALATHLARDGREVVVFEREKFPRFRIGESLLPLNMELFAELGVDAEMDRRFIRKYGANFSDADGARQSRFPFADAINKNFPYCYQVERAELDQLLLENAAKHGAKVFMEWTVREVLYEGARAVGLVARRNDGTEQVTVRCKVVADCSGRAAFCGTHAGLRRDLKFETRTAFFAHFTGVERDAGEREGDIQIVAFPHGWFWMIPFKGDTTSVGMVVTDAYLATRKEIAADVVNDAFLRRAIEETPFVRARMKNAAQKFPARSIANFSYAMDRYAGDGYVMVGDAGAFLDPVFSSGVFLTMKSAQLVHEDLRRAFASGDFSARSFARYEKRIRGAQAVFMKFIRGWYDPAFVDLFFIPKNILGLRAAITSVLAADLFDARHRWTLELRIKLLFALAELHRFSLKRSHGGRSLIQNLEI